MNTTEKIKSILENYDLKGFVKSCKGMTVADFDEFVVRTSDDFQKEICSFKAEDEEILEKYVDELSKIRTFYGKAINYVKYEDARLPLQEGEKELLEKLHEGIKRGV